MSETKTDMGLTEALAVVEGATEKPLGINGFTRRVSEDEKSAFVAYFHPERVRELVERARELEAIQNTIHANTPVMGDCTTAEALRGILDLVPAARDGLSAQRLLARVGELETDLATERRTANEALAAEYDAKKEAIARIEKAREVLEEVPLDDCDNTASYGLFNASKVDRAIAALEAKP